MTAYHQTRPHAGSGRHVRYGATTPRSRMSEMGRKADIVIVPLLRVYEGSICAVRPGDRLRAAMDLRMKECVSFEHSMQKGTGLWPHRTHCCAGADSSERARICLA